MLQSKILRICFLCAAFAPLAGCLSQRYATKLTVTDVEPSVAKKMKANASALLTELNSAFFNGKMPNLSKISGMSKDGKSTVLSLWAMTPFRCIETEITERGYKTPSGYQVRNIPFILKDMPEDEAHKEIVINFDKSGAIDDIYFALDMHNYGAIMKSENNEVTDMYRHKAILDFVEIFRTAYIRKDIELLAKVFSDDALIITGKVVEQTKNTEEKIEYQTHTQKEYISKLSSIFKNNAKNNVVFDNIEVVRHHKYDDIYGVRLKQSWEVGAYSETGYLFMLIDFNNADSLVILERRWQPEKVDGKTLSEDEILRLDDFVNSKE